jgi:hypothetical protein
LARRCTGDDTETKTAGNNKYDLLSVAAARKQAGGLGQTVGQEKFQVEVIHGGNRKVVEY